MKWLRSLYDRFPWPVVVGALLLGGGGIWMALYAYAWRMENGTARAVDGMIGTLFDEVEYLYAARDAAIISKRGSWVVDAVSSGDDNLTLVVSPYSTAAKYSYILRIRGLEAGKYSAFKPGDRIWFRLSDRPLQSGGIAGFLQPIDPRRCFIA